MDFTRLKEFNLDQEAIDKLIEFKNILQEENKKYNLTSIIEDQEIIDKHFYDSLLFTKELDLNNQSILDVGTGAGFPGLVLKIVFPNLKVFLLESNNKKIYFLNLVINKLNLKDIYTINKRAEDYSKENVESFDFIVSRAMAPLNILLEVSAQCLKVNGLFIALKSKNYQNEINDLNNNEKKLGLEFKTMQKIDDNILGQRVNIFYSKITNTPNEYPRHYSQIKKRPLGK